MINASIKDTISAINTNLKTAGGHYTNYSCKSVSWEDAERGMVGGNLSSLGSNITDVRLWEKTGKQLYTIRSDNFNEKLGQVNSKEIAVVIPDPSTGNLIPMTLYDVLSNAGTFGSAVGIPPGTNLSHEMDSKVSIRFQTTFLPVNDEQYGNMEFAPEMYNYQTRSDDNPRNLLLLCTTQGVAFQQDGSGAKKVFHHSIGDDGLVTRHWFEAERSDKSVGGPQTESMEESIAAAERGKATASVIGIRGMGTRFNVLMTIQVPAKQKNDSCSAFSYGYPSYGISYAIDSDDEDNDVPKYRSLPADSKSSASIFRSLSSMSGTTMQVGKSNAARVSCGSIYDKNYKLSVQNPERDDQHITITVVIYNTVAGGVPSLRDTRAAIDDMENLYTSCNWNGNLADKEAAFMKQELTGHDTKVIGAKVSQQPYVPSNGKPIVKSNVFPTPMAM